MRARRVPLGTAVRVEPKRPMDAPPVSSVRVVPGLTLLHGFSVAIHSSQIQGAGECLGNERGSLCPRRALPQFIGPVLQAAMGTSARPPSQALRTKLADKANVRCMRGSWKESLRLVFSAVSCLSAWVNGLSKDSSTSTQLHLDILSIWGLLHPGGLDL